MKVTALAAVALVALLGLTGCSPGQVPRTAVSTSGTTQEPPGSSSASSVVAADSSPGVPPTAGAVCDGTALSLEATNAESAGTGQSAWLITVLNSGAAACSFRGYPRLTALGADGKVLPFRIHYGGSAAVTNEQPVAVTIRPGGRAFVSFGKYRCDVGEKALVQEVTVILPGAATSVSLDRGAPNTRLVYCGPGDPGSELAVSPVEPTDARTRSH